MSSLYQDFGPEAPPKKTSPDMSEEEVEDEKLQAFENGYQAGWDDSVKAQGELKPAISSRLAESLQEASFQYHEMRSQLTRSVEEITRSVLDTVLPEVARASLGTRIVELVLKQTRDALENEVQLRVHDSVLPDVEALLSDVPADYKLIADAGIEPCQAFIQIGPVEHQIHLEETVQEIAAAVSEYFGTLRPEDPNDRSP